MTPAQSYVSNYDSSDPYRNDLVIYSTFEEARRAGKVAEIVNLETGERMYTTEVLDKCEGYAKGMLALGLTPGVDNLMVVGCPSMESVCLFAAAAAIGVGHAHPFVSTPREKSIELIAGLVTPKIMVCGEGSAGLVFPALVSMFDDMSDRPSSTKLLSVEHLFYDDTYKNRSPTQKYIKTLDRLRELGESVTDEQLEEAKKSVKPEFDLLYLFTSGSTGVPKCVVHTHQSQAYVHHKYEKMSSSSIVTTNINTDPLYGLFISALSLAGYMKKMVLSVDMSSDADHIGAGVGRVLSKAVIDESIEVLFLPIGSMQALISDIKRSSINVTSVKTVLIGGQMTSFKYRDDIRECFKGCDLWMCYSMSEIRFIGQTILKPESSSSEEIYYAATNTEVRITDESNEIVNIGEAGEVQAKSGQLFKEYRNAPEITKKMFTNDGFLKTGDVAVMRPDGGFVLRGRTVDGMRFKIFNKVEYPGPIENVVIRHPDIADALVVAGRSNDWMGDEVTYCLRIVPGRTKPAEHDLLEFCEQNGLTSDRQRPARIIYFDSFPYTDNGRKFSKKSIKEKVGAMIAEDEDVGKCQWFKDLINSEEEK